VSLWRLSCKIFGCDRTDHNDVCRGGLEFGPRHAQAVMDGEVFGCSDSRLMIWKFLI
jgi:hypothetical protein